MKICGVKLRRPRHAAVFGYVALFVALGSSGYALGKGFVANNGTFSGCVKSKTGVLRIVKPGKKCTKGEQSITFNQQGRQGATGPAGPQGSTGQPGPQGPAGFAGGPAGGDLTGSYPSPTIAAGKVGTSKLADASVTGPKLSIPMSLSWTGASTTQPMFSFTSDTQGNIPNPPATAVVGAGVNNTLSVSPALFGTVNTIFGNVGAAGVYGVATGTGGYGVYAAHTNTSGFGIALQVQNAGLGTGASIVNGNGSDTQPALEVSTSGSGPALKVDGNLTVTGAISAGTKDFKIDDPADPAHKYLVHTSVESPDAENVYNGNVKTDAHGYATVNLPSYFDAENTDPRYQLTAIGSFATAIIWRPERGNQFVIRTNQPRVTVSWQVTGIRNDPYARSQRTAAEQRKPAADYGRYLYPQGYGKPASDTISTPGAIAPSDRTPAARPKPGGA